MELLLELLAWFWPSKDKRQKSYERIGCILGLCVFAVGIALVVLFSL